MASQARSSNNYSSASMASLLASLLPSPLPSSLPNFVILLYAIVSKIAPCLVGAMCLDLAQGLVKKITDGTFDRHDYQIVKAVFPTPLYVQFKKDMKILETVREGERIAADVSSEKRVSKRAAHKDTAYFEAVADHAARCHPRGGFLAGSGLHWRPVEDEQKDGDCLLERIVKRKRLQRPNED